MKSLILILTVGIQVGLCQQSKPFFPTSPVSNVPWGEKDRGEFLTSQILGNQLVDNEGRKSVATAALYSFLLPGMGEMYAGDYGMGKYFTVAEGALWITLGSVHWYATWLQNDARSFAVQHAKITLDGKSDQYFSDIGNFDNTFLYDQQLLRDREPFKLYAPGSSFAWSWDTGTNREQYRQLRVSSDEMFNNTRFVAAAIALNHLVSAINAARMVIAHNKQQDHADRINLHAGVLGGLAHPAGIVISFSKTF